MNPTTTATFNIGQTYSCTSAGDSNCVWTFTVQARTAKRMTIEDGYDTKMFKLELKFWGLPPRKPTPFEFDLLQIFESVPTGDMVSKDALAQWKKLSAFNLLEVVDENSIVIDESDAV